MSSSNSFSSTYSNATKSTPVEIEDELRERENINLESDDEDSHHDECHHLYAYSDEPIADENWLRDNHQRQLEDEQRTTDLQLCLDGSNPVTSW